MAVPYSPYDEQRKHCINLMEAAFNYAVSDVSVRNVVIGAQWNQYLAEGAALTGEFGAGGKDYLASLSRLSNYMKKLKQTGKNVFLILNIPTGAELDPKFMAMRGLKHFPHFILLRDGGLSRQSIVEKYGKIQLDLKSIAEAIDVKVISPMDFLCDASLCSSVEKNGEPIYKDGSHLRPTYVRDKATFIDDVLISN